MSGDSRTGREELRRLAWRLDTRTGLAAMLFAAFVLRVLIAPHVGFYGDLRLFRLWAERLADVGPGHFYVEGQFADYPPGYLYVLWLTGELSAVPSYLALKLPAILCDLGVALVAGTIAARLAPRRLTERWPVRTLVAAGFLFNPATIALSAAWGQVDVVPAFFVLSALLLLYTGPKTLRREIPAFLLFAVAVAMKPQSGFVLPVMLYALYRRYFLGRPRSEWLDGALAVAVSGVLSLGLWAVSGLAFGLGPVSLLRFYQRSASVYPVTSANAFNLWGAVGFWRNDSTGDNVWTFAGVSALHLGQAAFLLGIVVVLWRAHRAIARGAGEPIVLMVASASVGLLGYALLTRMHERYMFVALAMLAPLAFVPRLRQAYAALSLLFVLNLWFPYAYFNAGWKDAGYRTRDLHVQPWFDWLLGGYANDTWQKKLWSVLVLAVVLGVAWFGANWARSATQPASEPDAPSAGPVPQGHVQVSETWTWPEPPPGLEPAPEPPRPEPEPAPAPQAAPVAEARWAPLALVALACVFGLVVLKSQTWPAQNLNDSAFHLQMVRWADGQIGEGRVPFDGWFPYLSLGSSHFHHYQSLPHILTAYGSRLTGGSTDGTYRWLLYLLLALWPIAVYVSARLFGWGRWIAASAAAVAPLVVSAPGYGFEYSSYTWQGGGVYTQLWAMWLLPLSWALTWRAVSRGRFYAAAALATALTMACHFITGYLAMLTIGVWGLVLWRPFLARITRAAVVAAGAALIAAWVLVPLVGDQKWTTDSEFYRGTIFNDSYGAGKVLAWLLTGGLFDAGRFPIVTILVFAGLFACVVLAPADLRARALLGAFTLSLLLFFGRPTLGFVLDLLPGFENVQIHRFIVGVHLAGILMAGVALGWLLEQAWQYGARAARTQGRAETIAVAAVAVAAAVVLLSPAWKERHDYTALGTTWIREQQAADATDGRDVAKLVALAKARGGGRVFSGLRGTWGKQYVVGQVPVYALLAAADADGVGFTFRTIASLSNDPEANFDEANPADYEMFDVRYLLMPDTRTPQVPATLVASRGRHRLYEVRTSGYFQVVDRAPAIEADRHDMAAATTSFMRSDLASRSIYPGVAFAGGAAPPPTFASASPPAGAPGRVLTQGATPADGEFAATVEATRPAVALLKATYDRRWTATVDGQPAKPVMMAPSLVGVDVPAGTHEVRFHYRPYEHYTLLLAIGAVTLLGLVLYPRRERVARAVRERRAGAPQRV